ncbi:M-phase inducer phosphatase-like isoform X2 [Teleopsis dalmanni]|uniref:M-phase inducer phosphatase-like isoform X2 n=1 Tax=Teleopsis dalmanni TaxID=139649 RepID=UPI0018CCBD40|nr:M-phase inducer phosphatase-like isoform X2 [Teleopsis dalmanni]
MMALALGQQSKSPVHTVKIRNENVILKNDAELSASLIQHNKTSSTASVSTASTKVNNSSPEMTATARFKYNSNINTTNNAIFSGGSGSSGSDNDCFNTSSSSSATALRRLYFRSGRSNKPKMNPTANSTMTSIPLTVINQANIAFHTSVQTEGVPKVVVMGSSAASMTEANISTSTDSASTLVTSITHTTDTSASETCDDSVDLGDNSGPSEPLFSSLEEPLLTTKHVDSEHESNDIELKSCSRYPRSEMNLQDSTESQESTLSIFAAEPTSTTPLLSNCRYDLNTEHLRCESELLPNTAPAPSSGTKHFTFDPPKAPQSASTFEKSRNLFTFRGNISGNSSKSNQNQQQTQQLQKQIRRFFDSDKNIEERIHNTKQNEDRSIIATKRENTSNKNKFRTAYASQRNTNNSTEGEDINESENLRSGTKKSRARDVNTTVNSRNRYSTGGIAALSSTKTSPKHEVRRSPTSSKINSAPPTLKESNFFNSAQVYGKLKELPPPTHTQGANQRKYSSSSSSGGSERDRRTPKDSTMFPFDREAIDYKRIQMECFEVNENSSENSESETSDSNSGESCSVYERKLSLHHNTPKSADIFQQYTLLSHQELQQSHHVNTGPPSRKNSKRIRSDFVMHSTIRENQQYIMDSNAFSPHQKTSLSLCHQSQKSHGESTIFNELSSKFEQNTSKSGSSANISHSKISSPNSSINSTHTTVGGKHSTSSTFNSPTNSVIDVHSDACLESHKLLHKKSYKSKSNTGKGKTTDSPTKLNNLKYNGTGTVICTAAGPINVTPNPMDSAMCKQPLATIVVQQPSLSLDNTVETVLIKNEGEFVSVEQGKDLNAITGLSARKRDSQQLQNAPHLHHLQQPEQQQRQKRDENIRQLLDVTNTLTFEELRDFEMRYGSPHHSRSQSVKTPGSRASGRPNQLCLPQQRSRVASMPNTGVEEEYYRLRHFSITGKGVVNRGDSLKSRRSRSNNSVASSNSSSTEYLTTTQIPAPNSARTSAPCSLASSRESSTSNPGGGPYRVLMLGGPAVGKSSLVSQFMTSEYLHAYDTSIDDESGEKSVSVLLSGEESELTFIDHAYTEMVPDDCLSSYDPHGYCVIYSAADRSSFSIAEHVLQVLWTNQNIAQKAVILVANKADLARSRLVTSDEGKAMATAYDCKFIETSVGINHNVDELLVGLLSQIRLKLENPEKSRDLFRKRSIRKSKKRACSPLSGACLTGGTNPNTPLGPTNNIMSDLNTPPGSAQSSPRKYRGSRTSTSLKVKGLLGRVWARDSKSKSCENLHVL